MASEHRLRPADHAPVVFSASSYVPFVPSDVPRYEGSYEVTPSAAAQVLATAGKLLAADVTIQPIPSNYGLITVSGHVITVS